MIVKGMDAEDREKFDNMMNFNDDEERDKIPESIRHIPVPSWFAEQSATKVDDSRGFVT